jgi:uncharacterized membrane protein YuzA (DUF378 family)
MYFIIGGDGKQYGPISEVELRKWVAEGRLNQQSMARGENDTEFRSLATFPELAALFGISSEAPGIAPVLGVNLGSREMALQKVTVPAIGLMVSSSICILESLYNLLELHNSAQKIQEMESQMQALNNPQLDQFFQQMAHLFTGPLGYANVILQLVIGILVLMGAIKMKSLRSFEFSIAAAILSVLPCINPCCGWIIGLIFGIWAISVLSKPAVKSQFT